jgi:hypothetical protein
MARLRCAQRSSPRLSPESLTGEPYVVVERLLDISGYPAIALSPRTADASMTLQMLTLSECTTASRATGSTFGRGSSALSAHAWTWDG